jgi:hypothetical protein
MADLTPQLRTRLSRVERLVGIFVLLATLLLLGGLAYYVYHTAQRKGWFLMRLPYWTTLESAAGLNVGDPVKLMGFNAGQITEITAGEPFAGYNVWVQFVVQDPYIGYMWNDSYVRLTSGDVFGKRYLELVQGGTTGEKDLRPTYDITNFTRWKIDQKTVLGQWDNKKKKFLPWDPKTKGYELRAEERPALAAQLESVAQQVTAALPGIWNLTNQLGTVLSNTASITTEAQNALATLRPALTNFNLISANLTNPVGSLGQWILPTNLQTGLETTLETANKTLDSVNTTVVSANTNVTAIAASLITSLDNLGNITSNLNNQVQANSNLLTGISSTVTNADVMLQGLRRHWFLKGSFKEVNKAEEEQKKALEELRRQQSGEPEPKKRRRFSLPWSAGKKQ